MKLGVEFVALKKLKMRGEFAHGLPISEQFLAIFTDINYT